MLFFLSCRSMPVGNPWWWWMLLLKVILALGPYLIWNLQIGFTSHGLPTDRPAWSDKSGKTALNKDNIKPPSVHWSWFCDWLIDFSTPGGVDHDGWQYATDFPASYHKWEIPYYLTNIQIATHPCLVRLLSSNEPNYTSFWCDFGKNRLEALEVNRSKVRT